MKLITLLIFVVSLTSAVLILQADADSYPCFAAYTGEKCSDCHVNPTGGIMRNFAGTKYAEKNLKMDALDEFAGKTKIDPRITKAISLGADIRVAQVNNGVPERSNYNSFLAMQGDIYLNAELNKIVDLFATSGIYIPGIETRYEVFGMLHNLPLDGFFKVGRFKPNYGQRIVEHRAYQRQTILGTPYDANTGFEIGISPDWFFLSAGLYNSVRSNSGFAEEFSGQDPHKMFVANTEFNFIFEDPGINFNFGGSFLNNPYNTIDSNFTRTITGLQQSYAATMRIGIVERVALLGEVDFEERKTDSPLRRSLYWFGEIDVIVVKGLELRGQLEYYDRNRDIEGDNITRYSMGVAAFPFYGFETEAMFRIVSEDADTDNNEWQWNFHFYF